MVAVDQFVAVRDWRTALYRGDSICIDRFLGHIDGSLPPDWYRDLTYEKSRVRPDRVRCYQYDKSGDVAVRVWLQRVTQTRVRGGPVQLLRHSVSGDTRRLEEIVTDIKDSCVQVAAFAAGVRLTRPTFGPRSVIASDAELLFTRLADTADGTWPLAESAKDVWDELISVCLAEHAAVDRDEFGKWLADSGWDGKDLAAISDQFFADSELLAKRLESMSQ